MSLHEFVEEPRYVNTGCKRHQSVGPPGPCREMVKHLLGCHITIPGKEEDEIVGASQMVKEMEMLIFQYFR